MPNEFKVKVTADLDTSEAEKKLNKLTKDTKKVKLDVDGSELDGLVKKTDGLKKKKVTLDTNVKGGKSVDNVSKSFDKAQKSASGFGNTIKGFAKFGAYLNIFHMIEQGAKRAVTAVKEIDDATVDIQIATNDSYSNVNKLVGSYNNLAKEIGATTAEVAKGGDTWLRQGESIANTNKLIKDTMVLSKDAKLSSDDSSSYLTAIRKGYKIAVDEVSSINDSLTSIDMAAAVDAGGLAEATSKVSASANLAGVSLNKLLGYEAAVGEASQESMSIIGNSFKTIFARMSDIKADKLELIDEDGTIDKLSDVETTLANVGIDLRKTVNEYNNYGDVLDNLASKWDGLNDAQQKAISKAFAGTRQQNRFQLLMENYDKATKYTNIAENSQGTALQKFNDAYLNSLEAKQKSLQASFESLSTHTISRDSYAGIVEATQAIVEFIDKTNLLKGAMAGLAVGGMMKGFVSITTGITQAAIKMQDFQKSLNLLKIGNIGEDGIQKLAQYTDGLSKSQLKAVLSSTELSVAQRMQILTSSGMSEAQASATLATMGLATAEGTATASTLSLGTAMKGLMSTMIANPILLATIAVTAGVSAWQSYKQSVEEANNAARESAQSFSENSLSLSEQISKVKELKSALSSGNLSDDEETSAKQSLLDIQNQLIDTYGQQAQGIDLVNGKLQEELDLMNQLTVQDANKYLNENEKPIDRAEKEMTETRGYYLGKLKENGKDSSKNAITKEIKDIASEFENAGIKIMDAGAGNLTIKFNGDAAQADKTIDSFMSRIRELKSELEAEGQDTSVLDEMLKQSSTSLSDNQKVLDEYQDIYNTALQSDMISKGFGEGKPATVLDNYTKAINAYNEALSDGDASEIDKAKVSFDEVKGSVDSVLKQYPEYQSLFDEVGNSLNETAIKAKDFSTAINGDDFKTVISQFKDLQDVDLKGISFTDNTIANGEEALKKVVDKAIELGIVSDDSSESIATVVDMLVEMGLTGTQSASAVSDLFEKANTSIQKAVSNIASLNNILSESVSGSGISAENVKAFRDMFGDEAELALEKTSNGYHINEEALGKLQKRQEEMTKSDYLSALSEQYESLHSINEQIAKSAFLGEDVSGLLTQKLGIEEQISSLEDLQLQYEAATSAYQKWQNAMSGSEEGDMYDSIFTEQEKVKELYEKGLTGTNEFKTYTDLLSSEDLSNASVDQIVSAYERLGQTIQGTTHNAMEFSTEGKDGCIAFLDAVSQLNSDWAHLNEDGSWDIQFGKGNDKEIADALGIDVEYVQSILRKLSDYGFDIELDKPVASLEELKSTAQSAKESLDVLGESDLADINLDTTSFSEITDDIDQVKEYINTVNESDLEPDVKTEKVEYANEILEYLVEKQQEAGKEDIDISVNADELEDKIAEAKESLEELKGDDGTLNLDDSNVQSAVDNLQTLLSQKEQLNAPSVMSVDVSQVDGELGSAIAKIQEYQSAVQDLNVQNAIKAQGVSIDTSEAEAKVQTLAGEIQGLNPQITANLGIDTTNLSTIQSSVAGISPQILVKAGVDKSAIVGYKPEDKSSKVKFNVDSSIVDAWKAPNKTAKVTYSAIWPVGNPPKKTQYVQVVETKKATGTMLSMKSHASGTLNAHANGRVALPRNERALVNELGTESRIRDGVWETIPGGMHVEDLKKGDIIINAKQTEELIKHGKVSEINGLSAYSSGSGKFSSTTSSKKKKKTPTKSGSSGGSSGGSGSGAEKASEEVVDWIATLLSRVARVAELAVDAIDRAVGLVKKQTATSNAISKTQNEISQNQAAANRYLQEANSVGLDGNYASKVQNGTLDIEKITNEDLKEKISKYKEYYENYLDATDKALELEDKLQDLIQKRLENIEDYYDAVVKVNEELADAMDAKNELNTALGKAVNNGDTVENIKSMINAQQDSYNQLYKKLTEYQNEFNNLVNSGQIKKDSDAYYEGLANIQSFSSELSEASKTLIEFEDKLREIGNQTIEYLIEGFKRNIDVLEAQVDLIESRDEKVPENLYKEQMDNNNAQIGENKKLLDSYLAEQALYDVNSERYQELADKINDVKTDTLGLMEANEELKDSIYELRFKPLDEAIEKYDKLSDEIGDFYDLLNEDAFFDRTGKGTADLVAGLALLQQQIAINKQKISDYTVGLEKLQESFDNGVISEVEYNEKSEEYREGLQDTIKANKDLADSISDLYMEQMEKETDYIGELADKYSEAADKKAKYQDYYKNVKEQQKSIDMLKAEAKALEGVNNATAQAELKRINAEIAEKQSELDETKNDHKNEMIQDGYSSIKDDLDKLLDDTEYEISHNADKQLEIINSMLGKTVSSYADAYNKINSIIANTGWVGSTGFNSNQTQLGTQQGAQSQNTQATQSQNQANKNPSGTATGTVTDKIDNNDITNSQIEQEMTQKPNVDNRPCAELRVSPTIVTLEEGKSTSVTTSIRPNDAKNKTLSWKSSNESVATVSGGTIKTIKPGSCQIVVSTTDGSGLTQTIGVTVTKKPDPPKPAPPPSTSTSSGADGVPRVGEAVTFTNGRYYYSSDGIKPTGAQMLGQTVYITKINNRSWATKPYHIARDAAGAHPLGWVSLSQLKGYKTGVKDTKEDELAFTHDNEIIIRRSDGGMLRQLPKGTDVFPEKLSNNLWDLAKQAPNILNSTNLGLNMPTAVPNVENRDQSVSVVNHYDSLLHVEGNVDKDALPGLKDLLDKSYKYTMKQMNKDLRKSGARKI